MVRVVAVVAVVALAVVASVLYKNGTANFGRIIEPK